MIARQWLSRFLLLPIGKCYSSRNHFKAVRYRRFLNKAQYWDRADLIGLANHNYKKIVTHCYHNVPYYRKFFLDNNLTPEDFTTIQDVTKLPILTKKIIAENNDELLASNYESTDISADTSGGTTGELLHFKLDNKNAYKFDGNWWRFWTYADYQMGDRVALLWGNESELADGESLREKMKQWMYNTKMLNFYGLSEERLIKYIKWIERYRPDIIRGYATAIYLFVKYCINNGINLTISPKSVIITSDKILKSQKEEVSDYFKCEIFEEYGCKEFGILAHECSKHQGLHLAEELFIFEVMDLASGELKFEGRGEIVVTSLFNYAMPFLRYRLGDEVTIVSEKCPCGRSLKKIHSIEGRVGDFVVTKSDKFIYQNFFANILSINKAIDIFQVLQHEKGKVTINLIKNNHFEETEMDKVKCAFTRILKDDLELAYNYVNEIEVPPSGKRRPVISYIASKYIPA